MPKRPEEMLAEMISSLKLKTGRSLDEWLEIIGKSGFAKHGEIVKYLKSNHAVSHGYANQIALRAVAQASPARDAGASPVDELFQGAKSALRPVYDAIMLQVTEFGADIDVALKKGYVSLRRSKQFAIIQPSTAARLDIGINLKGVSPGGRLEPSGSFNAMLTHRVRISGMEEVDAELIGWLRKAYDAA